jgi:hypothetical protein
MDVPPQHDRIITTADLHVCRCRGRRFPREYDPDAAALCRATFTSALRASFTAFESGKISASSGERTIRFVPWAKRFAYRPRSPDEKSYSALIVSPLYFFIGVGVARDKAYIVKKIDLDYFEES